MMSAWLVPSTPAADSIDPPSVDPRQAEAVVKPRTHRAGKRGRPVVASSGDSDDTDRPKSALALARELGISSDDSRPDQQRETTLLSKRLILGGKLSVEARGRSGYELASGSNEDDLTLAPEATLEAIWLPSSSDVVFAAVKADDETEIYQAGGGARGKATAELDSLWYLKTRLGGTPLAAQVGRQKMQDRRNWWWNDNIDAARLHYFGPKVTGFAGVGTVESFRLSTRERLDPEEKHLLRTFGTVEWEWTDRNTLSAFVLHQNDRSSRYAPGEVIDRSQADKQDASLTWIGARARGCIKPKVPRRICYWGDIAQVRGTELTYTFQRAGVGSDSVTRVVSRSVAGWGYDGGVSIELPVAIRPYLTLGYARGSGDPAGTPGHNGAFRQTGLHNNDGKYRGLTRFRYYGEVLRPDLSNIAIGTVALGVPVGQHSWVETIWHRYRQPNADNAIAGSRLNRNPDGIDPRLGDELDVVISHRPPSGWVFELTGGVFRAGPAFGSQVDSVAGLAELKIDYNF